jgi:hypothetical protein
MSSRKSKDHGAAVMDNCRTTSPALFKPSASVPSVPLGNVVSCLRRCRRSHPSSLRCPVGCSVTCCPAVPASCQSVVLGLRVALRLRFSSGDLRGMSP